MKTPKTVLSKVYAGLMLISAMVTIGAASARADLTREDRVLVVVSELDKSVSPELRPFYSILEGFVNSLSQGVLAGQYREIRILSSSNATLANYKATLRALALNSKVKAIDTIIALHGSNNRLSFWDGRHSMTEVRDTLLRANSKIERMIVSSMKRKLRVLYSTACFGASHRDEFIGAGYDVVAGAIGVNANGEVEFPSVVTQWAAGMAFRDAFAITNNDAAIALADGPVRLMGELANNSLKLVNSKKLFSGDGDIQIRTEAR